MDSLIRAAGIGPDRTRLRTAAARSVPPLRLSPDEAAARSREEIEARVRQALTAQMQSLCDAERERARKRGFAEGLADAQAQAAAEAARRQDELADRVERTLREMARAHDRAVSRLNDSVAEVSFAALCKLVGAELGSRTFVRGLVDQACAALRSELPAALRMHPRDVEAIDGLVEGLAAQTGAAGVRLITDETLSLGGCVIETVVGQYDAGLEGQLRRLHELLAATAVGATGD